jgi:hypothetical protein
MIKDIVKLIFAAALFTGIIVSCSLTDEAVINSRIDTFISDLNSADRSGVYLNFHPDVLIYDNIKPASYYEIYVTTQLASRPFSISSRTSPVDVGNSRKAVDVTWNYKGGSTNAHFEFLKDGSTWLIRVFTCTGNVPDIQGIGPANNNHYISIK